MSRVCLLSMAMLALAASGCAALPDIVHQPQLHNPFPQLQRVAVVPFINQSGEPTLDGRKVATLYYNELQKIPGFEVAPVGVTQRFIEAYGLDLSDKTQLRRLAELMNVDVVVIGSITDYTPYYPPRMGLAVDWYAANPGFHPIPPGYGLPWGTPEEEFIPSALVREAEFALAREQLKTQTPALPAPAAPAAPAANTGRALAHQEALPPGQPTPLDAPSAEGPRAGEPLADLTGIATLSPTELGLPPEWPDPRGFIPPAPQAAPPPAWPQHEPIISHVRNFNGHDLEFTEALSNYFFFRDDARFGGWPAYLQRSDDFIAFCCHLHLAETLAARGGAGKTRVVWRWPIGRYER